MTLNRTTILGNLTRDPEIRFLANEKAVANFTVASSRKFKSGDGETKEETIFLDCTAWNRTAEVIAKHFSKGKPIIVEGRLAQENWTDKETKKPRSKIVLQVDAFHFIPDGQRKTTASDGAAADHADGAAPAPAATTDEPPF